jgi:hypothetical protein
MISYRFIVFHLHTDINLFEAHARHRDGRRSTAIIDTICFKPSSCTELTTCRSAIPQACTGNIRQGALNKIGQLVMLLSGSPWEDRASYEETRCP